MPDITPAPASLLEAVFTPMTEYTHNVYSVKGDRLAMTLTKIGVAQAKEGANKRGNSSRLTQSFHFFMF
ncbi:hypothetical protein WJF77_22935, partial [Salmonella enterica subsp. enterica serovar Corvallis]